MVATLKDLKAAVDKTPELHQLVQADAAAAAHHAGQKAAPGTPAAADGQGEGQAGQ